MNRNIIFFSCAVIIVLAGAVLPKEIHNSYVFYASFPVLQFIVIGTGWNILGGYAGYINFGSSAFVGAGTYAAVAGLNAFGAPLGVQILFAALIGALLGLALGYLTLRLQGVFFSIATLALTIVLETIVVNWQFVGGAGGAPALAPQSPLWFPNSVSYVWYVMLLLAVLGVILARWIEHSWIGRGLAAIRADEIAAECAGVPTLKLKLFASVASGALIAVAGAPFPYYASYVDPSSVFSINYALNALAMPLIGGVSSWAGPVIGAALLGAFEQVANVTLSADFNLLLVGLVLVGVVALAPNGIIGIVRRLRASG